jgi:diguanylate cyclase (GGDEF)-like protein
MENAQPQGLFKALGIICNLEGQIVRVVQDDFGITPGVVLGESRLLDLLDGDSHKIFFDFLEAIRKRKVVSNWELDFRASHDFIPLSLSGMLQDEGICLVAAQRAEETEYLYKEIMSMMNAQVDKLRQVSKEHEKSVQRNLAELEEFSRLTNELITAQRELAKKNIALERANAQLYELATHDMLTGAENRRFFFERVEEELHGVERFGRSFGMLLMDIDHFKIINDTFGHLVGDKVLQSIGEVHRATLRGIDHFCRFGGEEFAVLLTATDYPGMVTVAERLRKNLAETIYESPKGKVSFTVSIGALLVTNGRASLEELLEEVDTLLYRAKGQGRDCVIAGYQNGKPG